MMKKTITVLLTVVFACSMLFMMTSCAKKQIGIGEEKIVPSRHCLSNAMNVGNAFTEHRAHGPGLEIEGCGRSGNGPI